MAKSDDRNENIASAQNPSAPKKTVTSATPRRERPATHQPSQPNPNRKKRVKYRSPAARAVIALLQIIGIGYAAILVVLVLMEDRLVYPGAYMKDDGKPVAEASSPVETVTYNSPGDIQLSGRLLERPGSRYTILFFHGNESKAKWLDGWLIELSQQCDATVMAAEYRGFEDDNTPNERGVIEDCVAASDYLCKRYDLKQTDLVLYGRSLGGGCAVAVASRNGAKALILESTFDRMFEVAALRYPFVPVRFLMRNRYDSVAKLTVYKGPLIQVHSTDDQVIPFVRGKTLYDSARSDPKHFVEVSGVNHIESMPISVIEEIAAKLNEFTVE
ncbi:Alpha/beta hydrolase family protein [Rubripirellula tenax]|uniref:Alpha/beta hydrolase family protein n=1 Tax=Rubripirellula tenax TaxID=2528015 RepID=A0A5C6EC43_9BACT|nr:alpha/beta hydrolase [Rubripirellula tenax]TWU46300.1 Alpha/beta hydrolase family protein [Rubripirellula tenax]